MEHEPEISVLHLQPRKIRTISSAYTSVMKILPSLMLAIVCILVLPSLLFGEPVPADERLFRVVFALVFVTLTGASIWFHAKLRWVRVDDEYLWVASVFKVVKIPLSQIEDVYDRRRGWIIVRLSRPSAFGRSIWFMGKYKPFLFLRPHPIAAELRSMAEECRARELTKHVDR